MSEAVTTIETFLRRAVEEAYQKGESVVICSDALLLEIAARIECIENERSAALRAQEQNEPLTLTGTRKIGEIVTGRIVALDAEKGLASIRWEPYAHEPKGAHQ